MSVGPPFIIDQRPDADRGILVTWSLPGLRRATVRVPGDVWAHGDHNVLGAALSAAAQPFQVVRGNDPDAADYIEDDDTADDVSDY